MVIHVGDNFGSWEIVGKVFKDEKRRPRILCKCVCGKVETRQVNHLVSGASRSCGCTNKTAGGMSTKREYAIWSHMLDRCYKTDNVNYRFYGAVGRKVCKRWRESVISFIADMGEAPTKKHSLDRKDTGGNYTCGRCEECLANGWTANCRWVTKHVQARNAKNNRYYTYAGETLILKDWAKKSGIKYLTLWNRLNSGWPFDEAIRIPVRPTRVRPLSPEEQQHRPG